MLSISDSEFQHLLTPQWESAALHYIRCLHQDPSDYAQALEDLDGWREALLATLPHRYRAGTHQIGTDDAGLSVYVDGGRIVRVSDFIHLGCHQQEVLVRQDDSHYCGSCDTILGHDEEYDVEWLEGTLPSWVERPYGVLPTP